jgi:hypothetical protein
MNILLMNFSIIFIVSVTLLILVSEVFIPIFSYLFNKIKNMFR